MHHPLQLQRDSVNISECCLIIIAFLCVFRSSLIKVTVLWVRTYVTPPLKLDTIAVYLPLMFACIFAIPWLINHLRPDSFVLLGGAICAIASTLLTGWNDRELYIPLIKYMIVFCIAFYVFARGVRNFALAKRILGYCAIVITLAELVSIYVLKTNVLADGSGINQANSYSMLLAAVVSLSFLFDHERSLIQFVNAALAIFLLLAMGARGPIVCLALFVALRVFLIVRNDKKKIFVLMFLTVLFILAFILFYKPVIGALIELFQTLGLSTRSLQRLLDESFFTDNARTELVRHSFHLIRQNLFVGVGLFQDRIQLGNLMGFQAYSEVRGWYPHNLFLELLLQFGVIVGGLLIVGLIVLICVVFLRCREKHLLSIFCIFLTVGFFPLMISFSYTAYDLFFLFLAFAITGLEYSKKDKGTL